MKCSALEHHEIPCRNLPVNLQLYVDHVRFPNPYICSTNAFETELHGIIQHITQLKAKKYRRHQLNDNLRFSLEKPGHFSQPKKHKMGANRSIKNECITCEAFTKKNVSDDYRRARKKYLGNTTIKRRYDSFSDSELYNQHPMRKKHPVNQNHPLDELTEPRITYKSHEDGRRKIPKANFNVLPTYCDKSKRGINDCCMQNTYCVKSQHEYCKSKSCRVHTSRNVENGLSSKKRVEISTTKRPKNETKSQRAHRKSNILPISRESLNVPLTNGTLKRNQGNTSRIVKTYNKDAEVFKHKTFNQECSKQLNQYNVNNKRRLRSGRSNYKNRPRGRKLSVCFHSSRQFHPEEKIKSREQSRSTNLKNKQSSDSSVRTFSSTHDETKEKKKRRKPEDNYIWQAYNHEDRNLNMYRSRIEYSPYFNAKKRNLPRRKSFSSRSQIDNARNKGHVRKHIAYSPGLSYYNVNRRRSPRKICNISSQSSIVTTHECRECCDSCIPNDRNLGYKSLSSQNSYYEYINHPICIPNLKAKKKCCRRCEYGPFCNIHSDVYLPREKCVKYVIENVDQCRNKRNRANTYIYKHRRDVTVDSECVNESDVEPTASCSSEQSSFTWTEKQTVSDSESDQCESEDLVRKHSVKYLYLRKKSKSGENSNSFIRLEKCISKRSLRDSCENVVEFDVLPMNICSTTTGTNTDSAKTCSKNTSTGHLTNGINAVGTNTHNRCYREQSTDPDRTTFPAIIYKKKNKFTNTEKTETHGNGRCLLIPTPKRGMKHIATNTLCHIGKKEVKVEKVTEKDKVDNEMQSDPILSKLDIEYDQTSRMETADKNIQTSSIDRLSQREKQVQTVQKETQSQGINPDKIKLIEQNVQTEMKNILSRGVSPYRFKGIEKEIQTEKEKTISRGIVTEQIYREEPEVQTSKKEVVSRGVNPDKMSRYEKDVQTVKMETFSRAVDTDKTSFIDKNVQVTQIAPTPSVVTEVDYVEETENTASASELSMHLIFEKCHEDIYKRCKNGRTTKKAAFNSDDIGQHDVSMRKNRAKIHEKFDNIPLPQDNHHKTCHKEETCFNRLLKQVSSENTTRDRREKYNNNKVTRNIKITIDNSKQKRNNNIDNSIKYRKPVLMDEDSGFTDSDASYSDCTLQNSFWHNIANEIKDDHHAKD